MKILLLAVLATLTVSNVHAQLLRLEEHRFQQDGQRRDYLLYTPKNAAEFPGKRPLVLVIHGGGGTARSMARLTKKRFHALADRDGFYVLYPNAVSKMWDFGEGKISNELKRRVDDLAYFRKVIDDTVQNLPIDPKRVFATVISRGGQACYFVAGKLPNKVRAIAPITMPIPEFLADDCAKGSPIGILLINGTTDPIVPYGGGQIGVLGKKRGAVLSTDATVRLFQKRNRSSQRPFLSDTIDPARDGTKVVRSAWRGTAPVVLYRVENGGHTWPSGTQYFGERIIGKVTKDIDGAVETWSFFKQFQ